MYSGKQRKKLRLQNYNYSQNGYYFVTICTKNRENYFGKIINSKMQLNQYGEIVYKSWKEITQHYKSVELDEFIIMPNHIHGIITIHVGNEYFRSNVYDECNDKGKNQKINLSNIIKGFKIGCTKEIRKNYKDYVFAWQKSFFDIIIKNEEQLHKTREYIINNPLKWELDVNNPINIK